MTKIIAIANQKGGVGKTTTAINLSASLSVLNKRVLVIDADPQANTTSGLGLESKNIDHSIYECMVEDYDANDCIQSSNVKNLDILPSHIDLVGAEIEMVGMENREKRMSECIQMIRKKYDYIIIDCSPSLGLITLNALTSSDAVLIPVQCEYYALEGLGKLLETVKIVQERLNKKLIISGILLTMYDKRLNLANQVVNEVRKHFDELVYDVIIPRNTKLGESPSFGMPAILYDVQSKGSISYLNLAKEIINKNKNGEGNNN